MNSKVNYTAVGLFVVVLGLLLGTAVWWLASAGQRRDTTTYAVFATDNVNGLKDSSDVLYRGVRVGQVASISIVPDNPALVRILLDIDRDVPVRADTVAQLSPQGVTGLSVINLSGGHAAASLVAAPGQPYPVIRYAPSVFSKLEGGLSDASLTLSRISARLDKLLSDRNLQDLGGTLQAVAQLSRTLDEHRDDIAATLVNLRRSSEELAAAGAHGDKLVEQSGRTLEAVEQTARQLRTTLDQVDATARSWDRAGEAATRLGREGGATVEQLQQRTLPAADRLSGQLQQLSVQLTDLVRSLKGDPSQLLYGAPQPAPGPGEAP